MSAALNHNRPSASRQILLAASMVLMGSLSMVAHGLSVLRDEELAGSLVGNGLWKRIVTALGGSLTRQGDQWSAHVESAKLTTIVLMFAIAAWLAGGACIAWHGRQSFRQALIAWGVRGWAWWLLPLAWESLDLLVYVAGWSDGSSLLRGTLPLWHGLIWAGWLTTGCALGRRPFALPESQTHGTRLPAVVWGAMALYVLVFGAMNLGLYESLQLPHGDSAMYEEHLWNLLHGKGFRSYLDDGRPFLGEHIQVIHALLIPVYLLWPSQVTLELCQSAALAAGAIPLFRIALRHSGSTQASAALAIAYLLYVPMQFLDIAIDLKTFRPNSFEIPLLLVAFDALESRRWRTFFASLGLALLCQEDAATIIAPLGIWIFFRAPRLATFFTEVRSAECGVRNHPSPEPRLEFRTPNSELRIRLRCLGAGLAVFGAIYLILVIKLLLPWFRGGGDVHFAQYFPELGTSSNSIVVNVLLHPQLVLGRLLDVKSIGFALVLLAPLGLLPLFSPGRLAVAAPLFGVLCLSDITNSAHHHFHAPLVPVLLWASAAGIAAIPMLYDRWQRWWQRSGRTSGNAERRPRIEARQIAASGKSLPADAPLTATPTSDANHPRSNPTIVENAALWCALSSLCVGWFLGLSPASIGFWDPDSRAYWRTLYLPGERAQRFPEVLSQIPHDSRVASTDFIHPRFTHFTRSYDYSDYRPNVPKDADYIVIDTRHRYSAIHRPDEIKEYRDHPEEWELLPDRTDGYFIVLRRVRGRDVDRRSSIVD
jgi:uncharacterized membrane protein